MLVYDTNIRTIILLNFTSLIQSNYDNLIYNLYMIIKITE